MPVSIKKKVEIDLTIFKATGEAPFNDQMNALKLFYEGSPTSNVLWDFMEVDEVNISSEELRTIVRYTKAHSAQRKEGRTALVVNTKLKYGLARMASVFAEIEATPWDIEVFENMDEAMAWFQK